MTTSNNPSQQEDTRGIENQERVVSSSRLKFIVPSYAEAATLFSFPTGAGTSERPEEIHSLMERLILKRDSIETHMTELARIKAELTSKIEYLKAHPEVVKEIEYFIKNSHYLYL